jgi:hypothetical protein
MQSGKLEFEIHPNHTIFDSVKYCIPTDNARLVAAAELQFFDQIDPNGSTHLFSTEPVNIDDSQCQ